MLASRNCKEIEIYHYDENKQRVVFLDDGVHCYWQPHTDSGDSRDLQVAIGASLQMGETIVVADIFGYSGYRSSELYADHNNDKGLAANYAVLRVAAAIGRAL